MTTTVERRWLLAAVVAAVVYPIADASAQPPATLALDARPLAMEWPPLGLGFRKMALMLANGIVGCGSGAAQSLAKIPLVWPSRAMTGPVFTRTYGYPGSEIDLLARASCLLATCSA